MAGRKRSAELHEYLLEPVRALGLRARIHGVRYPQEALQGLQGAGIEYAGWLPNYRVPAAFARYRVTVHVPRRPYVEALPGIPTIRPFEVLACGIPLISAPWNDCEGLFTPGEDFLIARECDAYLMHGDPPEALAAKIEDMRARRAKHPALPPLRFGVAGYAIVRNSDADVKKELARITDVRASARGYASYQDFIKGSQLETKVSLEDYSVSNRGLRTGLVGTPEQVAEQVRALERIGIDLLLLQSSPQREEMERFSSEIFPLVNHA